VIPTSGQRTVCCSGQGPADIATLQFPGLLAMTPRADLGLRDSGRTSRSPATGRMPTLTRVYNAGKEHNRLPRKILAVIYQDIARVQFQVDP
jgi:hypothetical protein